MNKSKLASEFQKLEQDYEERVNYDPEYSMNEGLKPENILKNRYQNIIPLDRMRVKLPVSAGHSDYINASWIKLNPFRSGKTKTYIASQGPTATTINDFWHMVYDSCKGDRAVIVMLTPLAEKRNKNKNTERWVIKCDKYWPDSGKDLNTASSNDKYPYHLRVELKDSQTCEYFDVQHLQLVPSDGSDVKNVTHYYMHSWADFGLPHRGLPLQEFIKDVNQANSPESPLVVHCSAGIGRTGTYIALDATMNCIDENVDFDTESKYVYDIVDDMRKQRGYMVQQLVQYQYVYDQVEKLGDDYRKVD